jgi:hypothetical protein
VNNKRKQRIKKNKAPAFFHTKYYTMRYLFILVTCLLLVSCAPDRMKESDILWLKSLTVMPRYEGYRNTGFYSMGNTVYTRLCDSHGNAKWMRYNKEAHSWSQFKYETHGCRQDS